MKSMIKLVAQAVVVFSAAQSFAAPAAPTAAQSFHDLLRSSLPPELQESKILSMVHMVPDASLTMATEELSVKEAIADAMNSSLDQLVLGTFNSDKKLGLNAEEILSKKPMTLVIVPGIFGEFIPNRAFEEILAKPSLDREQFRAKVQSEMAANNPDASDKVFDIQSVTNKDVPLSDLVNVGCITDAQGKTLVKVVLMYTPFMSLESMGSLSGHAANFNRRLAKYLSISGQQNVVLVGYSRGTDLALEMLAQAKAQNLPFLSQVKSMISLGGVLWGSTLADATEDASAPQAAAVQKLKILMTQIDESSFARTLKAWGEFAFSMGGLLPKLGSHPNMPKESDLKASPIGGGVDVSSVLALAKTFKNQIGLSSPVGDFSNNVKRFKLLVTAALDGVHQLTSNARTEWWKSHAVPLNITYYAITAAMPNPDLSALQSRIFDSTYGYSHRSYDDLSLLQNRLDYESSSHIALNDSQVSVPQAMFLPAAIAALNPANKGMRTQFLGTLGTHHWGLALQVVNAMKDGRKNPFPREALLKALAAQVASEQ